jgi:hypothetical protein
LNELKNHLEIGINETLKRPRRFGENALITLTRLKAAVIEFALIAILVTLFIIAGLCAVDLAVYLTDMR